jgi:FixJ family two-component response regulator
VKAGCTKGQGDLPRGTMQPSAGRTHHRGAMAASREHPDLVRRHGHVVILVEDDAGLRTALERMLRTAGFEAQAYADAESVLADHLVDWADCMVIDVGLPALSGFDLLQRLRDRGVTAPAVVISAQDEQRLRLEAERRGVMHFLAKPFLGSALLRLLDGVIGNGPAAGGIRPS